MRTYNIYIINEEFANYYYGRERMFYDLFKDFNESHQIRKEILEKQITYITDSIPSLRIHTSLMKHLQKLNTFFFEKGTYHLVERDGKATLDIFNRYIQLQAFGNIEPELKFMDVLATFNYHFYAVDLENERFGWVKPYKIQQTPKRIYQN